MPNTGWVDDRVWAGPTATSHPDAAYTVGVMERAPVVETMDSRMVAVLRAKTPTERLAIAFGMWRSARDMLTSLLSHQHPEWSGKRVAAEVARRLSHGAC